MLYKQAELFGNTEIEFRKPRSWYRALRMREGEKPQISTVQSPKPEQVAPFTPVFTGNRVAFMVPPEPD